MRSRQILATGHRSCGLYLLRRMKILLPAIFLATNLLAQQPGEPATIPPVGADDKPLNLGFESGTLKDWNATGDAFSKSPMKGNSITPRRPGMASKHAGEYWVGTYESGLGDAATGRLTSASFKVTQPWASFLVGGGDFPDTRVEVLSKDDNTVIATGRGAQKEDLGRVIVDLRKMKGREIVVRIIDENKGPWGHINFDDFVFHAEEPKFPKEMLAAKPGSNLPVDDVKFAGLKPEEVPGAATVPEGYELKVFTAEPDLVNPISFCQDDRARIWVVEGRTYPTRAKEGEGKDRVLIFEDVDGDGKADKRTVFMENLNLVSGIEVGHGGVWIGAAPYLYFVPVENWDDPKPAGEPKVMLDGWGYQDTHETLNTFHWGPDGWLYGCHGVFTHSKVGKPGTADADRVKINAGIWRFHPQRHEFEVFAHGTSNPWGIDWNEDGEMFAEACVIPHLFHIIPSARYTRQAGQHFNPYTYKDIETIADHRHYLGGNPHGGNSRSDAAGGGHAHAGLTILQHPSWPEKLRGGAIMGNIHGQRINMDILERKGSGYVAKHGPDFINFNDRASQIVDIREGPEGTLFMIDWYDLNACHRVQREAHDYTTGRIYRLAKKGAKLGKQELAKASEADLYNKAITGDEWTARQARRLLQERKIDAAKVADLEREFFRGEKPAAEDPKGRARGLMRTILLRSATVGVPDERIEAATEEHAAKFPGDALSWVARITMEDRSVSAGVAKALLMLAQSHESPVTRLGIASACQRMSVEQRKPIVAALLAHGEDAKDHNLPLMYWYAVEPIVGADAAWAAEMLATCKIPLVNEFIARRLAE
jgi:putative membrane-bound dehydrogenase-like protein